MCFQEMTIPGNVLPKIFSVPWDKAPPATPTTPSVCDVCDCGGAAINARLESLGKAIIACEADPAHVRETRH